jgi:hypothetical protein
MTVPAYYSVDGSPGYLEPQRGASGASFTIQQVWSPTALAYVSLQADATGNLKTTGSGGGGGGAVTIADGADVAQGYTSDSAVYGDVAGTEAAKLRGISSMLRGLGTANAPSSATVSSADSVVLVANSSRKKMVIMNLGTVNVNFGDGATAVVNSGITLTPNGTWVMDRYTFTTAAIHAICSTSAILAIQEYQ